MLTEANPCAAARADAAAANRRTAFWAAFFIQRDTGTHLPWLAEAIATHLPTPPSHCGDILPMFYVHGLPCGTWTCSLCLHPV